MRGGGREGRGGEGRGGRERESVISKTGDIVAEYVSILGIAISINRL